MAIPFTRFHGPLKRLALSHLSASEHVVFEALFPRFFDRPSGGRELPRRFGGFLFPRGRYYTVCIDDSGYDDHTLVHELRAYRNPATSGMVEVIDLVEVAGLTFDSGDAIPLEQGHDLGVLLHEPERMPSEYQSTTHQELRSRAGERIDIIRLPYIGYEGDVERAIDLRLHKVREWFFETFRESRSPDGIWWPDTSTGPLRGAQAPTSLIAHTRFNIDSGRAPLPASFAEMLPTLVNPELGGGPPSSTGSTLYAIGQWLRAHGAEALIYPSARCDVSARRGGTEFSGWNLVDYRNVAADKRASLSVIVTSPWCWTTLPRGVEATFTKDGFSIVGAVRESAEDYLRQLHSVRLAETALRLQASPRVLSDYEAWKLGVWLLRWLSDALASFDSTRVESALSILTGLAVRRNLYRYAGRARELFETLQVSRDGNAALRDARLLADDAATALGGEMEEKVRAGIGFETLMLTILIAESWGEPGNWKQIAFATAPEELALPTALAEYIRSFLRLLREARPPFRGFIAQANAIEREISDVLFARG